ncbi:MAG: hypothetical protein HKN29_07260 [Rhodothermales bacterium]|nr:hypothetical protein [Rhodothermales bacterium]
MTNLTDADLESIRQAVASAEGVTSGEIVPFVAARSSDYRLARWKGAALMGLVAMAAFLGFAEWNSAWSVSWTQEPWALAGTVLAAMILGWLLATFVPSVLRLLAGERALAGAVHHRALRAFVDEEVFDTRDRTGILLFVSLMERRIEVMGDAGINARVSAEDWVDVIQVVRQGILDGRLAQGLVAGIGKCGELLRVKGVEILPDDENELPDGLRVDRG